MKIHNNSVKNFVIITGGGFGTRMRGEIPKQFLLLAGLPILMHTINKFLEFDTKINIILTLPETQIEFWKNLCSKYDFNVKHQCVAGGETRFHSVRNAVQLLDNDGITAVHDAVRPLVSPRLIKICFEKAKKLGAIIPVLSVKESLRFVENEKNISVNRDFYKIVQTPQVFHNQILIESYQQPYQDFFTDDASVVEAGGNKIFLTDGEEENIKITLPQDLKWAEFGFCK